MGTSNTAGPGGTATELAAPRPGQSIFLFTAAVLLHREGKILQQDQGDRSGHSRHSCTTAGAPHAGWYSGLQWCPLGPVVSCDIYRNCKCRSQATADLLLRGRSSPLGTPAMSPALDSNRTSRRCLKGVQYVGRPDGVGLSGSACAAIFCVCPRLVSY
jgi:hypothetical protein